MYVIIIIGKENEVWELEKKHTQDKHQLLKQQMREAFHMQRHQMQMRHQKVGVVWLLWIHNYID